MFARRPHKLVTVDAGLQERFRLVEWSRDGEVRRGWIEFGLSEVYRLLGGFASFEEANVTSELLTGATQLMCRFNLRSNDALHLATALAVRAECIATVDGGFQNAREVIGVLLVRDS